MRNGFTIRTTALVVSIALHAVWFVQVGGSVSAQHQLDKPTHSTVTRLTFAVPEPVALQEPVVEPLPKPEPVAQSPKPIPVRKPKPVKKKQPVLKAKRKSKPVAEEIHKLSMPAEPVQVASVPVAALPPAIPAIDEGLVERERQRYLAKVMAHIEKHKLYPKVARRRGIEGEVKISFLLMDDGSIRHVDVKGGPKVLRLAAAQAVAKAGAMSPPPSSVHCPLSCKFAMRYAIN